MILHFQNIDVVFGWYVIVHRVVGDQLDDAVEQRRRERGGMQRGGEH